MSEPRHSISAAEEPAAVPARPASTSRSTEQPRHEGRRSPHSSKFFAVSATLIVIAVGALAVAGIILIGGSRAGAGPKWSAWSPQDGGVAGEREIAAAVSPFYRAAPATQLVVVTVNNINGNASTSDTGTTSGGTQIALRDPSSGSLEALSGTTAMYNLCGLGPNCAISTGSPSAARMLLLRREALELSLYTFRYIKGIDNVVAVLPPARTTSTSTGSLTPSPPNAKTSTPSGPTVDMAVLFQRQSLAHYLSQPLSSTLPEQLPPTVSEMSLAPEAELVSVLTGQSLFEEQKVQSQDGSNVLVLQQMPPQ